MNMYGLSLRQHLRLSLRTALSILLFASVLSCSAIERAEPRSELQQDKHITFFTSYGYQLENRWHIPFRVWANETPDTARELTAKGARKLLRNVAETDDLTEPQKERYLWRVRDFVANSKSGQKIAVSFDKDPEREKFTLESYDGESETDFNGILEGSMELSNRRARQLLDAQNSKDNWLSLFASSGEFEGRGRVQLVPLTGLSIISDIDDTAKVTGITEGESVVLNNVFFSDYKAAPCMAQLYRNLGDDAVFHYVSGAPWQLYKPTTVFLFSEATGFPPGSVHMKNVRTNFLEKDTYIDFWKLAGFSGSATIAQKTEHIERILGHFPDRRFVFIGDSGEHDPEIFADIRRQHPAQVNSIRIRDVVNAAEMQPDRLQGMIVISPDGKTCN